MKVIRKVGNSGSNLKFSVVECNFSTQQLTSYYHRAGQLKVVASLKRCGVSLYQKEVPFVSWFRGMVTGRTLQL